MCQGHAPIMLRAEAGSAPCGNWFCSERKLVLLRAETGSAPSSFSVIYFVVSDFMLIFAAEFIKYDGMTARHEEIAANRIRKKFKKLAISQETKELVNDLSLSSEEMNDERTKYILGYWIWKMYCLKNSCCRLNIKTQSPCVISGRNQSAAWFQSAG